jgi:hypothetical protein
MRAIPLHGRYASPGDLSAISLLPLRPSWDISVGTALSILDAADNK